MVLVQEQEESKDEDVKTMVVCFEEADLVADADADEDAEMMARWVHC